ncbi:hypothetical protein D9758_003155 [Tetrapyrgos nigripes]|uniref:Uncharacterized protein n=1 Tax=Tetrapyrgos nigripes TaxID=182062 RepID=A0A8H5GJ72_9AGAR|nr:hypothetical protein D9758_003155 [Tetrapyrgos nigripes]
MSIPTTMPTVYVYPPEEDDEPPFCCFDAAQPLPRDFYDNDDLESFREPAITTTNTVTQRSIADEYDDTRRNCPGDNSVDSDVVEVVKVRKRHAQYDPPPVPPPSSSTSEPALKDSKTLKYRASRAFNSIKNVARARTTKKQSGDSAPVNPEVGEPSSRVPSPSSSRRSSVVISQIFTAQPSLHSRPSSDSFNDDAPHPIHSSTPVVRPISTAEMHNFTSYTDSDYDDDDDDEEEERDPATPRATRHSSELRSSSPSPSTSSRFGRRRFSVLNLFSSASAPALPSNPTTLPNPPIMSRDPSAPLTDSSESSLSGSSGSSIPVTPVDEVPPRLPSSKSKGLRLRGFSFSRKKEGPVSAETPPPPLPQPQVVEVAQISPGDDPDMSFVGEMRLDSLHFDGLSFDVDRF